MCMLVQVIMDETRRVSQDACDSQKPRATLAKLRRVCITVVALMMTVFLIFSRQMSVHLRVLSLNASESAIQMTQVSLYYKWLRWGTLWTVQIAQPSNQGPYRPIPTIVGKTLYNGIAKHRKLKEGSTHPIHLWATEQGPHIHKSGSKLVFPLPYTHANSYFIHFVLFWFITLHIPLSFTPGLKLTCFTNPIPVVLLLPPGLPQQIIA